MSGEGTSSSGAVRAEPYGEGTSSSSSSGEIRADNVLAESPLQIFTTTPYQTRSGIRAARDVYDFLVEKNETEAAAMDLATKWMEMHQEFMAPVEDDFSKEEIKRLINADLHMDELRTPDGWIKDACVESIRYILKTSLRVGHLLRPETAYLAVMYLIKYVSTANFVKHDFSAIRLVAVASLILAAFREDSVFELLSFSVDTDTFTYAYNKREIKDMQYRILKETNWESSIQNPFRFTPYFVRTFCPFLVPEAEPEIKRILLELITDITIRSLPRASIITLAATIHLVAEDEKKTPRQVAEGFEGDAADVGLHNIVNATPPALDLIQQLLMQLKTKNPEPFISKWTRLQTALQPMLNQCLECIFGNDDL